MTLPATTAAPRFILKPVQNDMKNTAASIEPLPPKSSESDYGSDIDSDTERQVAHLLRSAAIDSDTALLLESIEEDGDEYALHPVAHVPKSSSQRSQELDQVSDKEWERYFAERQKRRETSVVVEYDEISRRQWSVAQDDHPLRSASLDPNPEPFNENDTRSPLERFRTKPKKPLSVTDLISPAWCEIQYWYTLTKYGKKRRTPAMKQGSVVHKKLEDEVHTTVEVQVTTKEDMWGLKIWNVIQGLRTLRATGMTRELEIWGVIDGQVVNGIIDELSYSRPMEAVEGEFKPEIILETDPYSNASNGKVLLGDSSSEQRLTINDFFKSQGAVVLGQDPTAPSPWLGLDALPQKQVYLTDVKTRSARTLPQGSSLLPTKMQLFIYHHIITALATNSIKASILFDRYSVDPSKSFTDGFIAQVGGLDFNFREDSVTSDEPPFESAEDGVSELLAHNSLTQLWQLMIKEYQRAIPLTDKDAPAISDLVRAEFRRAWDGTVIGSKVFRYNKDELDAYLKKEMQWWKGERKAVGVDIEDAFKCRICEFAEGCEWRKGKVDEAVEKTRLRKRGRPRKSEV